MLLISLSLSFHFADARSIMTALPSGHIKDLIRTDVHDHRGTLETRQQGNGAYTLRPLPENNVEVDHVWECQAGNNSLSPAFDTPPTPTRGIRWSGSPHQGPLDMAPCWVYADVGCAG